MSEFVAGFRLNAEKPLPNGFGCFIQITLDVEKKQLRLVTLFPYEANIMSVVTLLDNKLTDEPPKNLYFKSNLPVVYTHTC